MKKLLKIATRKSPLAMMQARLVGDLLSKKYPHLQCLYVPISSLGDRVVHGSWEENVVGVFVKELEEALLEKKVDLAVHSLKDMPFLLPSGLHLAAFLPRAAAGDVLISSKNIPLKDLPDGVILGTSSMRRSGFLKIHFPHLQFCSIRGSIETRIKKMQEGQADGLILAEAALDRLSIAMKRERFSFNILPPAAGQGIVAVESRIDDEEVNFLLKEIDDRHVHFCSRAERKSMGLMGLGCRQPFSAHAVLGENEMQLDVAIAEPSAIVAKKIFVCGEVKSYEDCDLLAENAIKKLKEL